MVAFSTFTEMRLDAQRAAIKVECDCDENGDALLSLSIEGPVAPTGPDPIKDQGAATALLTPEEARALVRALNCVLAGLDG